MNQVLFFLLLIFSEVTKRTIFRKPAAAPKTKPSRNSQGFVPNQSSRMCPPKAPIDTATTHSMARLPYRLKSCQPFSSFSLKIERHPTRDKEVTGKRGFISHPKILCQCQFFCLTFRFKWVHHPFKSRRSFSTSPSSHQT